MAALSAIGQFFKAHLTTILGVVGVVLLVGGIVLLVRWLQGRKKKALPAGGQQQLKKGQLLELRNRFLSGLPRRYRPTVANFPTVVVLGPAGSGKSRLIEGEVDWRRQANQFMPSLTTDPNLQIYLGPDVVVQEISAQLMEDESTRARDALKRLWEVTFRDHEPIVVIAIDAGWLTTTPPDDVRRTTQLLRGKINLLAEIVKAPVETRLTLTHMDHIEGFTDFASLLQKNGVPLSMTIPPRGEEAKIAGALEGFEKYLALALTALTVDAFERLESFFSLGRNMLAGMARFVGSLWEGGAMARPPKLSNLYMFSPIAEARSEGIFELPKDEKIRDSGLIYRRIHLRRAGLVAAAGMLPILAAYGFMYYRVSRAHHAIADFSTKVTRLQEDGHAATCRNIAASDVDSAVESVQSIARATRWWPPLKSSFMAARLDIEATLATGIRDCYLRPFLDACQKDCPVGTCKLECTREQALYTLAVMYAARGDGVGHFILEHKGGSKSDNESDSLPDLAAVQELVANPSVDFANLRDLAKGLGLPREVIATYVGASADPFKEPWHWDRMLFVKRNVDEQLKGWLDHFTEMHDLQAKEQFDNGGWEKARSEGRGLRQELVDSEPFRYAGKLNQLLHDSPAPVEPDDIAGIKGRLDMMRWIDDNRQTLTGMFRMEEQADHGLQQAKEMSWAELLTRSDGMFVPGDRTASFKFAISDHPFEFSPEDLSRTMLDQYVRSRNEQGLLTATGNAAGTSDDGRKASDDADADYDTSDTGATVMTRAEFDSKVKPELERFTRNMTGTKLLPPEAAERQEFVLGEADDFAKRYRRGLLKTYRDYEQKESQFDKRLLANLNARLLGVYDAQAVAQASKELRQRLEMLMQSASPLTEMLRDVGHRADLGKLEGPYFDPIRNAITPFKPIVRLATPDKDGLYPELNKYTVLLAQFTKDISGQATGGGSAPAAAGAPAAEGASATPVVAKSDAQPAKGDTKAPDTKGKEEPTSTAVGGPRLPALLSPLAQVALPMLLDDPGSYFKKVDAFLDAEDINGEFRRPFRQPFVVASEIGKKEVEAVLKREWEAEYARTLAPLFERYPFNPRTQKEIDPPELDVLRRKDGQFWIFVDRVIKPVCSEDGLTWSLRRQLDGHFELPKHMIEVLNHFAQASDQLWDKDGNRKPLALQLRPQTLPAKNNEDLSFVTMSYVKSASTSVFGFNQQPAWADFPLAWWNQETSSVGIQLSSPNTEIKQYHSLDVSKQIWSFFRLMESATVSSDNVYTWHITIPGGNPETEDPKRRKRDISFGMRGDPWGPFRIRRESW